MFPGSNFPMSPESMSRPASDLLRWAVSLSSWLKVAAVVACGLALFLAASARANAVPSVRAATAQNLVHDGIPRIEPSPEVVPAGGLRLARAEILTLDVLPVAFTGRSLDQPRRAR